MEWEFLFWKEKTSIRDLLKKGILMELENTNMKMGISLKGILWRGKFMAKEYTHGKMEKHLRGIFHWINLIKEQKLLLI